MESTAIVMPAQQDQCSRGFRPLAQDGAGNSPRRVSLCEALKTIYLQSALSVPQSPCKHRREGTSSMFDVPETHYAKSGDLHIAYQVTGTGSRDLIFVPGFVSHLDLQLQDHRAARFFERLSSFSRLIRFDKRG